MNSCLYTGTVMHARRAPRENVFRYRVCVYLLDLDELEELDRTLPLFGWNRPNVATFHERDHIDVRAFLARNDVEADRILLLTNLRVLGYVFNPVSFYWCYRGGELACIVAEVNNTFGERLPYLLRPELALDGRGRNRRWASDKRLHVSPFMPLDQCYRWHFSEPGEQVYARVDLLEREERPFLATLAGRREELTPRSHARALARYPLMPWQVIGLIHWQAVKLYLKGVPFRHKPPFVPGKGSVSPSWPPAAPAGPAPPAAPQETEP